MRRLLRSPHGGVATWEAGSAFHATHYPAFQASDCLVIREDMHLPRLGTEHAVLASVGNYPLTGSALRIFKGSLYLIFN